MSTLDDLRLGDAIGYCDGSLLGAVINLATLGVPGRGLSHFALVAPDPHGFSSPGDWLGEKPERHLLYESTMLCDDPCAICGDNGGGVHGRAIRPRLEWMLNHGRAWHYPLRRLLNRPEIGSFLDFIRETHGLRYDATGAFGSRSLLLGWLIRRVLGHEDLSTLFCSEQGAAFYRRLGRFATQNVSAWNPNSLARALVREGVVCRPRRIILNAEC